MHLPHTVAIADVTSIATSYQSILLTISFPFSNSPLNKSVPFSHIPLTLFSSDPFTGSYALFKVSSFLVILPFDIVLILGGALERLILLCLWDTALDCTTLFLVCTCTLLLNPKPLPVPIQFF